MAESVKLPRVAITFCTQCRWMLRAAYFGQELLSTFSTAIGEIALIPATGGIFTVELTYTPPNPDDTSGDSTTTTTTPATVQQILIWDRKTQGGFPETKVLKQLIRDKLQPHRDLGHSDRHGKAAVKSQEIVLGNGTGDGQGITTHAAASGAKSTEGVSEVGVEGKAASPCEDCN